MGQQCPAGVEVGLGEQLEAVTREDHDARTVPRVDLAHQLGAEGLGGIGAGLREVQVADDHEPAARGHVELEQVGDQRALGDDLGGTRLLLLALGGHRPTVGQEAALLAARLGDGGRCRRGGRHGRRGRWRRGGRVGSPVGGPARGGRLVGCGVADRCHVGLDGLDGRWRRVGGQHGCFVGGRVIRQRCSPPLVSTRLTPGGSAGWRLHATARASRDPCAPLPPGPGPTPLRVTARPPAQQRPGGLAGPGRPFAAPVAATARPRRTPWPAPPGPPR